MQRRRLHQWEDCSLQGYRAPFFKLKKTLQRLQHYPSLKRKTVNRSVLGLVIADRKTWYYAIKPKKILSELPSKKNYLAGCSVISS
jgi:hypothetical protein